MPAARLLIVDDEPSICFALSRYFGGRGDACFTSASAEDALANLPRTRPDVVFLDIRLPGLSGLEAMERFAATTSADADALPPAVIVMTAHGTMAAAIDAMRRGAYDYLVKPVSLDKAALLVDRLMQSRQARRRNPAAAAAPVQDPVPGGGSGGATPPTMAGNGPAMQELFKQIGAVAARAMPVLVLGETGSGKELTARAIHAHGPRAARRFVAVAAAALSDGLDDATATAADTGTLFLDEIADLPPAAQPRLLRFLDDPTAGGRRLDVRLITATQRDLQDLSRRGEFRPDLLHRLNVARLRVPPLRERREDVPALADHLLRQLTAQDCGLRTQHSSSLTPLLAEETLVRLRQYDWPGNVRELRNVLQQALLVARDGVILPAHLPPLTMPLPGDDALARRIAAALDTAREFAHEAVLNPVEKELLRQAMERHQGNLSRAAEHLGLHRATLRTKLRQHGLSADDGGK
jgi:two-component system nitrogen regulation response regulator GlnG